jgi:hypothetical protein
MNTTLEEMIARIDAKFAKLDARIDELMRRVQAS